jgi:molybdopterin synthase sulfur carrier subunit
MSVRFRIPTPFRKLTGGLADVAVEGGTVAEAIDRLEGQHPGLREKMFTEGGALKRFVVIYVNEHDIRTLDELATRLKDGDVVAIVPAIAGGCCRPAGSLGRTDGC